jgi:hypothetical protein
MVGTPVAEDLVGALATPDVVAASLTPDGVGTVVAAHLVGSTAVFVKVESDCRRWLAKGIVGT